MTLEGLRESVPDKGQPGGVSEAPGDGGVGGEAFIQATVGDSIEGSQTEEAQNTVYWVEMGLGRIWASCTPSCSHAHVP